METFHWNSVLTAVFALTFTAFAGALKELMFKAMVWAHGVLSSNPIRTPVKITGEQKDAITRIISFLYGLLFAAVVAVFILKNGKIDVSQAYYSSDDLVQLCEYPQNSNFDGKYFPVYKNLVVKYPQFVNIRDTNGLTPLMRACNKGNTNLVTLLLGCKYIDVNATNSNGWNALSFCTNVVPVTTNDDGTIMIKTEQKMNFMIAGLEREITWPRKLWRKIRMVF